MKGRSFVADMAWPLLSGAFGLALWQGLVKGFDIPVFLLPAPTDIAENYHRPVVVPGQSARHHGDGRRARPRHFRSLRLARRRRHRRFAPHRPNLTPWLVVAHAVPKVVIAPLFLVWFGFGLQSEMFFVVAFTFFPVIVNTVTGLKSADPEQLLMVRAMGANRLQVLHKIQFPNA